jgi:hypothetical protein
MIKFNQNSQKQQSSTYQHNKAVAKDGMAMA